MNDKKQKLAQALRDNLLRRKQQARGRADMAADAEAAIRSHDWPGNVRELLNLLQRAALLATGEQIRASDLGLPLDEIAATLRAMIDGDEIADLNVDDQAIPIFLEAEGGAINDPTDLVNLYVRSAAGETNARLAVSMFCAAFDIR